MLIRVRHIASLHAALGPQETTGLPKCGTIAQRHASPIALNAAIARGLARGRALRFARDQNLEDESAPLSAGAEVASFLPSNDG